MPTLLHSSTDAQMEIFAVERLKIFTNCCNEGTDVPADCFRATCNPNVLYAYFACSIRNRLEVWKSDRFENPKRIRSKAPVHLSSDEPRAATVALAAGIRGRHSSEALELQISSQQHISEGTGRDAGSTAPRHTKSKNSASCWGWIKRKREAPLKFSKIWQVFGVDDRRPFNVPRPTKLVDGSRGGQAFMCELPRPKDNEVYMYPIEEQARMQLLSVLLVATLLIKDQDSEEWEEVLKEGFQLDNSLGTVFQRLFVELVIVNFFLICFIVSICYALWVRQGYALRHTVVLVGVLGLWRHWPFDAGGQSEGKNKLQKRVSGSHRGTSFGKDRCGWPRLSRHSGLRSGWRPRATFRVAAWLCLY